MRIAIWKSGLVALVLCLARDGTGRAEGTPEPVLAGDAPVAETPVPQTAPAVVTNVWDMARAGDGIDESIPFPGFGLIAMVASSYTVESPGTVNWEDKGGSKMAAAGRFSAELQRISPDWKTLRSLLPVPKPGDQVVVKKLMWGGASAWMVDMTLSSETHPPGTATRQRHLVAPLEDGFLLLSLRGPTDQFEADREAMRRAALSIGFCFSGLRTEYYNSTTLEYLGFLRLDPTIDFDWGTGGPSDGVGPDCFSVRWTGKLKPLYSETYTFSTMSDDGVRLWVKGQPIVDNWTVHAATEDMGSITLKAGEEVDLRMEWYENLVHAVARLSWQSTSQAREVVPSSCLSSRPPPGLAAPPELGGRSVESPAGWPVLLYAELPGGYTVSQSPALKWSGDRPSQTLLIGEGAHAVQVALRKVHVRPGDARTLLPNVHPADQIEVQKVAWRYATEATTTMSSRSVDAPASRMFTVLAPEHYGWAWSVDCTLDAASHPETKLLYRWYCLVPLKRGLLVFSFASQDQDWLQANWDAYRTAFDSVSLTAEEQPEDKPEVDEAVF